MNIATNSLSSTALRAGCRDGSFDGPTSGHALGYVQANMVILPKEFASEFREYCDQNPQPCPVLEILDPGIPEPKTIAPGADVRTDLPRYRVFRDGIAESEPTDITNLWSDDLVTFLLGCSFIAEDALLKAGLLGHPVALNAAQLKIDGPLHILRRLNADGIKCGSGPLKGTADRRFGRGGSRGDHPLLFCDTGINPRLQSGYI